MTTFIDLFNAGVLGLNVFGLLHHFDVYEISKSCSHLHEFVKKNTHNFRWQATNLKFEFDGDLLMEFQERNAKERWTFVVSASEGTHLASQRHNCFSSNKENTPRRAICKQKEKKSAIVIALNHFRALLPEHKLIITNKGTLYNTSEIRKLRKDLNDMIMWFQEGIYHPNKLTVLSQRFPLDVREELIRAIQPRGLIRFNEEYKFTVDNNWHRTELAARDSMAKIPRLNCNRTSPFFRPLGLYRNRNA